MTRYASPQGEIPKSAIEKLNIALREDNAQYAHSENFVPSHAPSSARIVLPDNRVVGTCLLARYRRWLGVIADQSDKGNRAMGGGKAIENWQLDKIARRFGGVRSWRGRCAIPGCKLPMKYELDMVTGTSQNGDAWQFGPEAILELKSGYGRGGWYPGRDPKISWLLQAGLYSFAMELPVVIVAYNNDTGFSEELLVDTKGGEILLNGKRVERLVVDKSRKSKLGKITPEKSIDINGGLFIESIFDSWRKLEEAWFAKVQPNRDYDLVSTSAEGFNRCVYGCGYMPHCLKDIEKESKGTF
jgi:hypothetical protein